MKVLLLKIKLFNLVKLIKGVLSKLLFSNLLLAFLFLSSS